MYSITISSHEYRTRKNMHKKKVFGQAYPKLKPCNTHSAPVTCPHTVMVNDDTSRYMNIQSKLFLHKFLQYIPLTRTPNEKTFATTLLKTNTYTCTIKLVPCFFNLFS